MALCSGLYEQSINTITRDNGSKFTECAKIEVWGTKTFFVHPYTSWEQA